jgi:signal peptidase I
VTATAFDLAQQWARRHRPSRRTAVRVTTFALMAGVAVCAALVWPGFVHGGTAYVIVSGNSMEPTLHSGDLVLTARRRTYDVGDIVAYRIPEGRPGAGVMVIHRIVGGSAGSGYTMRGDNRAGRDIWRPRPRDIVGGKVVSVPRFGRALVFLRTPLGLATLTGILTALFVLGTSGGDGSSEGGGAKRGVAPRPRRDGRTREPEASLGSEEPVADDQITDGSSGEAGAKDVTGRPRHHGRQGPDTALLASEEPAAGDAPTALRLSARFKGSSMSGLSGAASRRRISAAVRLRMRRATGRANCAMNPDGKPTENCRTLSEALRVTPDNRERDAVAEIAEPAAPTESAARLTSW